MKFNPNQTEIQAKQSSLAIRVNEDDKYGLSFYVYNRRNRSIIHKYEVTLLEHCRRALLNAEPIPKGKRK